MNLIEKVASAIDKIASERGFPVHKVVVHHLAGAAIEAMLSIKWQKIETLPEEYKTNGKKFLAYTIDCEKGIIFNTRVQEARWIGNCYSSMNGQLITHWAAINVPEDE